MEEGKYGMLTLKESRSNCVDFRQRRRGQIQQQKSIRTYLSETDHQSTAYESVTKDNWKIPKYREIKPHTSK